MQHTLVIKMNELEYKQYESQNNKDARENISLNDYIQ